jgi:hypothetical protein
MPQAPNHLDRSLALVTHPLGQAQVREGNGAAVVFLLVSDKDQDGVSPFLVMDGLRPVSERSGNSNGTKQTDPLSKQ